MSQTFTPQDVSKVAILANIPLLQSDLQTLAEGFTKTMSVVEELNTVNVELVEPTDHVTGLENVFREDIVDAKRMFTQEQALSNAPRVHNGFFVVNQVIEQEE